MRVIGIDPGTHRMGVGVVDSAGSVMTFVFADAISAARSLPLHERLSCLHEELLRVIETWRPSVMAIEDPFVSPRLVGVKAAMAVGQAQAVGMLAAASFGIEVFSYSPRQVKQAVTDYGGSSKSQVQEMVRALLGLAEAPQPTDAADALAVAICHINVSSLQELVFRE